MSNCPTPLYVLDNLADGLRFTLEAETDLPAGVPITGVGVIATQDGQWLLADIPGRGLSIPGGEPGKGETPEQTARRELYEETGAELGPLLPVCRVKMEHTDDRPSRFPPLAYGLIFTAEIVRMGEIPKGFESRGVHFVSEEEAEEILRKGGGASGTLNVTMFRRAVAVCRSRPTP